MIMSSTLGEQRQSLPKSVSSLDVDTVLSKYRVTGTLGKGGQGVVYEVRHVELDYPAVIKMLRSRHADDPDAIERFKHEAHTLARIRHPSIVTVHDVVIHTDGHVYIVLERLDGESLEHRLRNASKLEPARAVAFIQQVGRALAAVDGTRAISGSHDKTIKLWDTQTGELVRTFHGRSSPITAVAPNTDGARALSCSKDNTLELWDTQTGSILVVTTVDRVIYACALSSTSEPIICAGAQSGRVHFLRLLAPASQRPARR